MRFLDIFAGVICCTSLACGTAIETKDSSQPANARPKQSANSLAAQEQSLASHNEADQSTAEISDSPKNATASSSIKVERSRQETVEQEEYDSQVENADDLEDLASSLPDGGIIRIGMNSEFEETANEKDMFVSSLMLIEEVSEADAEMAAALIFTMKQANEEGQDLKVLESALKLQDILGDIDLNLAEDKGDAGGSLSNIFNALKDLFTAIKNLDFPAIFKAFQDLIAGFQQ